ncbi:MAG: hypothetical protein HY895_15880 [Deltaproteobacteria bacterium]|nr:hypothetical protein [Deltaproteobacteria bacterium]
MPPTGSLTSGPRRLGSSCGLCPLGGIAIHQVIVAESRSLKDFKKAATLKDVLPSDPFLTMRIDGSVKTGSPRNR